MKYIIILTSLFLFIIQKTKAQNFNSYISTNFGFNNILAYHQDKKDKNKASFSFSINYNLERKLSNKDFIGIGLSWLQLNDRTTRHNVYLTSTSDLVNFDTLGIVDITRSSQLSYLGIPIYFRHEYQNIIFKHGFQGIFKYYIREIFKQVGDRNGKNYKSKEDNDDIDHFKKFNWGYFMGIEHQLKDNLYLELNSYFSPKSIVKKSNNSRVIYSMIGIKVKLP